MLKIFNSGQQIGICLTNIFLEKKQRNIRYKGVGRTVSKLTIDKIFK